jgi:phage shock protein A
LARIEMESDIASVKARGEVAAELEHELKNLRKHEESLRVEREHAQGMADIRVGEQDVKLQSAMAAFEVVQQKKQERMRLQAELNTERQAQTDDMQKEILDMAAEHSALTPEVMLEFLKQQTAQKVADK